MYFHALNLCLKLVIKRLILLISLNMHYKQSLQFTMNRVLFKIFGAMAKDSYLKTLGTSLDRLAQFQCYWSETVL